MPPKVRSGAAADEDEQVSKSSYRDFVLPQLKTMDNHDELVVFRSCVKHLLVGTSNTVHETASVPPANYDAAQFEQEEARLMSKILAVLPASFVGSCETNLITTVCGYIGELSKRVSELASAETVDSVTAEINAVSLESMVTVSRVISKMEFLQRRLRIATGEAGSPGPGRQLHNAKSIIEKCLHVSPFLLEACAQCPEALNEYQQSVNNLLHICNEQRALAKDTYDTLLKKDYLGIIKTAFQKLIMSTPIRSAGVLEGAAVQREKDDQRLLSEQLSSRAASQPPPVGFFQQQQSGSR